VHFVQRVLLGILPAALIGPLDLQKKSLRSKFIGAGDANWCSPARPADAFVDEAVLRHFFGSVDIAQVDNHWLRHFLL
jgi:hypothetical protein